MEFGGFEFSVGAGNIFTLSGATFNLASLENASGAAGAAKAVPTKAPPQQALSSYGLYLDVNGHIRYYSETADAFTDSAGTAFGAEKYRFWDGGVMARLFAIVPRDGVIWTPYATVSVDLQIDYRDFGVHTGACRHLVLRLGADFLGWPARPRRPAAQPLYARRSRRIPRKCGIPRLGWPRLRSLQLQLRQITRTRPDRTKPGAY